jgi:hypothetical protein
MVTIWPRRDMNKLSFFQYVNSVPFAFRYDTRFARMQFNGSVRFGLSNDLDASRNYVEYLVSIRMDLASVRCVILNRDDADGHAVDSRRRTRLMGSGGYGEVTLNVEQVARNIDWSNSVYQAILLLEMTHARSFSFSGQRANVASCSGAEERLDIRKEFGLAVFYFPSLKGFLGGYPK